MEEAKNTDYKHREVGGRSYHNTKSSYPLPNDEEEHKRLDDLQIACRLILGGNVFASIPPNPSNILDLGTGSGLWCVEVAKQFPHAEIIGLDISPVHREIVPSNCRFVIGNFNEGLKFDDNSIDLVHSRFIRAGITKERWPILMREVYRIIKPGTGWVQCGELNPWVRCDDGTCPEDAAIFKFNNYMLNKVRHMNVYEDGEFLEKTIKDAGFVDVQVRYTKMYNGAWVNDHTLHEGGKVYTRALIGAVEPLTKSLIGPTYFTDEQSMNKFIEDVKADFMNPNYHLYGDIYVVFGRKPDVDRRE